MLVKLVVDVKFEELIKGQNIHTLEIGSFNVNKFFNGGSKFFKDKSLDLPCDINHKLPSRSSAKVRGNGRILSFADSMKDWEDLKFIVSARILKTEYKVASDNYMKHFYPRIIFKDRINISKEEITCQPLACRWVLVP